MVKYPAQTLIGGTLLLGLAFSLSDGSVAQKESSPDSGSRTACVQIPARDPASFQVHSAGGDPCLVQEAKK